MLFISLLLALILPTLATPVSAAQFSVSTVVSEISEPDNAFGLHAGDPIVWQVFYPDTFRVIPGEGVVTRDDPDVSVFVKIGSFTIPFTTGIFTVGIRNGSPFQVLTETGDSTACPVCLTGPWVGDVSVDRSAAYVSYTGGSDRAFDIIGDSVVVSSPVPESSSFILLLYGVVLVYGSRRIQAYWRKTRV